MDEEVKVIPRFLSRINETPDLWKSFDARVIAMKINDSWHNLITYICLDHNPPDHVKKLPNLPKLPYLACWQVVLPVEEMDRFLYDICASERKVDGEKIQYMNPVRKGEYPYGNWYEQVLYPAGEHHGPFQEFWNGHAILSHGDRIDSIRDFARIPLHQIENDLRNLDNPVDGLADLSIRIFGKKDLLDFTRDTFVMVYAPFQAWINEKKTYLEIETLHYTIYIGPDAIQKLVKLNVLAKGRNTLSMPVPLEPVSIIPKEDDWIVQEGGYHCSGEKVLPGTEELTLLLQVGKYTVQRLELSKIMDNPRRIAYQVFDPELKKQLELLENKEGKKGFEFERAVARLFMFLGFETDILSGKGGITGDAPDFLAYAIPEKIIFAVECTSESIDSGGKLGKLHSRSKAIAEKLPEYTIFSIMATSLYKNRLSEAEISKAGTDRITVLTQEDLRTLLEMSRMRDAKNRSLDYLRIRNINISIC